MCFTSFSLAIQSFSNKERRIRVYVARVQVLLCIPSRTVLHQHSPSSFSSMNCAPLCSVLNERPRLQTVPLSYWGRDSTNCTPLVTPSCASPEWRSTWRCLSGYWQRTGPLSAASQSLIGPPAAARLEWNLVTFLRYLVWSSSQTHSPS